MTSPATRNHPTAMRRLFLGGALVAVALVLSGCWWDRPDDLVEAPREVATLAAPPPIPAAVGAADNAPSVDDIEAELVAAQAAEAAATARVAALEQALAAADEAKARAARRAWQVRLWWVAGLGTLVALAGVVLAATGLVARRWAALLITAGVSATAGALTLSWLLPWLEVLAPVLGALVLGAMAVALWKQRKVAQQAVHFGNQAADALRIEQPKTYEAIRDDARAANQAAGIENELHRLVRTDKRKHRPGLGGLRA